ncbi:MAG: hypothetical protein J2P28_09625, partial [Actinobacteria bacterium]|nr:hypothetical protein [Actinomycetota bacterium]
TLARRHLNRPMHIRAEQHDEPAHVPTTQQHVFRAHQLDKVEVLARILQAEGRGLTIVFSRTKRSADQVATALSSRGFAAAAVHGDLGQSQRERAMRAFRSGKVDVLVATDVAARGLDVEDVTHVINYECPEDEKAYLHRIGRTGRAGRDGVAVTFVDWNDLTRWTNINAALHLDFPEPVETYSTSEHLYAALGIPAGAAGLLPRSQRGRLGLEAESLEDIGETGKTRSRSGRSPAAGPSRAGRAGSREASGRSRSGRAHNRDGASHDRASRDGASHTGAQESSRTRRRTRGGKPVASSPAVPQAGSARRAGDRTPATTSTDVAGAGSGQKTAGPAGARRSSPKRPPARGRAGGPAAASKPAE